jgi:hypothetical protein
VEREKTNLCHGDFTLSFSLQDTECQIQAEKFSVYCYLWCVDDNNVKQFYEEYLYFGVKKS